ncbi:MAG: type I-U CRISPR-associated protein Csx17 [Gammaproteobacteria bacterium]|nr:type I-U CRISPR-associated protein Csx17 [Gammaproteobacteria bacterium]
MPDDQEMGHGLVLNGCTPSPLSHYLKGLGVLRVLSTSDDGVRAAWRGECLVLYSARERTALCKHLLSDYSPAPVMAPWNGGSGFYAKDNKKALHAIIGGTAPRLAGLRDCLKVAEQALAGMDRQSSPKGDAKNRLLTQVRALLPDAALDWFDAVIVLAGDSAKFPPLLGTGGNDGRLDFTNNFMQRLLDVMDADTGAATQASRAWLELALFGEPAPALVTNAIGQFAPGQVGGPNASTGFDGSGGMNPWDFILMLEGAMLFAAAAVRRNASDGESVLSYPFTVRATAAGVGSLGAGDDGAAARGELWLPLWSQPAAYTEVRSLLAEGRVALGQRPARDALDFVRAVHRLGGYRGVDRYQRFGLLMRSGKAYLAAPLERVQVTCDPRTDWIDELDNKGGWLAQFRYFAKSDTTANRFAALCQRLENLLFDLARRPPQPGRVQALLALLGEIQSAIATSAKAREKLSPVPRLSKRWTEAADDQSPTFRIARALAGLRGSEKIPLPLRSQWYPVHPRTGDWMDDACKARPNDALCEVRLHSPRQSDLPRTLITLLERRLWLAKRLGMTEKPLLSRAGARLNDLMAFLHSDSMDAALTALLPGLILCDIPAASDYEADDTIAPAAYALLKLVLTPESQLQKLDRLPADSQVPIPPGMLAQLASGQSERAVGAAWRRLHASGLSPISMPSALPKLAGIDPRRAAASLLIPLNRRACRSLARIALNPVNPLPHEDESHGDESNMENHHEP